MAEQSGHVRDLEDSQQPMATELHTSQERYTTGFADGTNQVRLGERCLI